MPDHTTTTLSVRGCNIGLMRGGAGRPLVFLHGASGGANWQPFMSDLAGQHDVIAPEHPGFGGSDTPGGLEPAPGTTYSSATSLRPSPSGAGA